MTPPKAGQRAQAMAELALVLPLLVMLVLGALDVGRGALAVSTLANAVREGARAGVAAYAADGWEAVTAHRVRSSAPLLSPTDLTVSVRAVSESGDTFVAVSGTYRLRPVTPLASQAFGEIVVTSSSRMLVR